jgi:hypothetical protein
MWLLFFGMRCQKINGARMSHEIISDVQIKSLVLSGEAITSSDAVACVSNSSSNVGLGSEESQCRLQAGEL